MPLLNETGWLGWVGLALLAPIFLANATGLIDQATAIRELNATGAPLPLARLAITGGRILQFVGVAALFYPPTRPYAALALAAFLIPATLAAHAFWKATPERRDMQIAGFLKNTAIIGGLVMAAAWRGSA